MNSTLRAALLTCSIVLVASHALTASASLIGDQVGGYMIYKYDPNVGNLFQPGFKEDCPDCIVPDPFEASNIQPVAIVLDPDIIFKEFLFRHVGLHDVSVDIDEASVDLSLINTSGGAATQNPFGFEIYLTSLNWFEEVEPGVFVPGIITSASIVDESLFPGLSVSVIDGGTGLLLDFSNTAPGILDQYNANGSLDASIVFETVLIPEPATCVLAGLGLLGIFGTWRTEKR